MGILLVNRVYTLTSCDLLNALSPHVNKNYDQHNSAIRRRRLNAKR